MGTLVVTTSTTGEDIDPDGYTVSVDGGSGQTIGVNAVLTISGLAAGDREVELTEVASNCVVAGENPRTVTVPADGTVNTDFDLTCEAIVPPHRAGRPDRVLVEPRRKRGNLPDERGRLRTDAADTDPAFDGAPAISPDGTRILFVSDRDGDLDIFVMNADGSDPVNLTQSPGRDRPADWSPDGSRIVFSSDRTGAFEIYVMNADGSDPVPLTDNPDAADFAPAWSPDGTRIAFTSRLHAAANAEIHVMNADGSERVNLTNSPTSDDRWPSWSPDGSAIAFSTNRTGDYEVFVMQADGSQPTNVSNTPGFNDVAGWPQAWSPQ